MEIEVIPEQLQKEVYGFCKLYAKTKNPFEYNWQNNVYRYNDSNLKKHISTGNYGVVTGYGNLRILDIDDKKLAEKLIKEIDTFTVKTCGGTYHFYFESEYDIGRNLIDGKGEFRANKQMVVGANCYAIDEKKGHRGWYIIVNDIPIKKLNKDEMYQVIEPYLKKVKTSDIPVVAKEKDMSRNGVEYRHVCRLLRQGKTKEEIWQEMDAFEKWNSREDNYKENMYDTAKEFIDNKKIKPKTVIDTNKPQIQIPKRGKLVSEFAMEVTDILKDKNKMFYRPDAKCFVRPDVIETKDKKKFNGFREITPNALITIAEEYITPIDVTWNPKTGEIVECKSISSNIASVLLASPILEKLPKIDRIFNVPIPIIYEGELTFPERGYDERFNSWLPYDAPTISHPNMDLETAKELIEYVFSEFCFEKSEEEEFNQNKTNAIAGLLTPFLRGMFSAFNIRTPTFFYIANRERCGKDFLAGVTGVVYEGCAIEDPPISTDEKYSSSNEELRKKILSAFLSGRKRIHFSNNKGFINNSTFEGIATASRYSDRRLGKNDILNFDNELDFSLSANTGVTFTPDFANRCIFIKLFLDIENPNDREFNNPQLHQMVLKERSKILSALYALVRNWIDNGSPKGSKPFASFPEWAEMCGGIMECAGYQSPCNPNFKENEIGGDVETRDMKKFFQLVFDQFGEVPQKFADIKNFLTGGNFGDFITENKCEGLFSEYDMDKRSGQIKFGIVFQRFVGRILGGVKLIQTTKRSRVADQLYQFIKVEGQLKQLNEMLRDEII